MRILLLCHNLIERGNYFRAIHFGMFLSEKGHDVTFMPSSYRWYKTNRYQKGGLKIVESPSFSFIIGNDDGWSPLGVLHRLGNVIRNRYDVVYAFSHKPVDFIPAIFSRIFRGSFYISDWCDWWGKGGLLSMIRSYRERNPDLSGFKKMILSLYDGMEAFLEEYVPRKAHLVTVICKSLHQRALDMGIPEERLLRLISGADLENIKPMDKQKAREKIGLFSFLSFMGEKKSPVVLGYAANYHLDETLLLETLSRVNRSVNNVITLIVGPAFRVSQEQLEKWGIKIFDATSGKPVNGEYQIIHFGRKPFKEMNFYLGASDILLLPLSDITYNRGRWPHKIGDYLASGRPVVVNNVGDIPDLLKGHNAGCVAEPDPEDFSRKIIQLIEERNHWNDYGDNARRIAETELSWNGICGKLYARLNESFLLDKT
ncbi:glycosyltransferase [Candidatus Sumerlaeota bacterium]|nr:glycosyltransferase [Candidatus Sumerlaeota bacterium]